MWLPDDQFDFVSESTNVSIMPGVMLNEVKHLGSLDIAFNIPRSFVPQDDTVLGDFAHKQKAPRPGQGRKAWGASAVPPWLIDAGGSWWS
jgi:hypothetical protein